LVAFAPVTVARAAVELAIRVLMFILTSSVTQGQQMPVTLGESRENGRLAP
jgi:hypothetical protein